MIASRLICFFGLVGLLAGTDVGKTPAADGGVSPVLRNSEPADTRVVMLPGRSKLGRSSDAVPKLPDRPPDQPQVPRDLAPTQTDSSPAPPSADAAAEIRLPLASAVDVVVPSELPGSGDLMPASGRADSSRQSPLPPPAMPRAAAKRPEEFEKNSALFCQKQIALWTEQDARDVLGDPAGERPAFGKSSIEDGRILAFTDPTGRHMRLELDFDGETGLLRTVFAYPWDMRWADCRRVWGVNVSVAKANNGRMFYSYLDRKLDVLVEPDGKVVSLGLY